MCKQNSTAADRELAVQAEELAKVQEEFTAVKAHLAAEKQGAKERVAELEAQMAVATEEAEQRRSDLSDEVQALQASVQPRRCPFRPLYCTVN